MRIAIATFTGMPPEFRDDELLLAELRKRGGPIEYIPWDSPDTAWERFDLVVARSVWDYATRRDEFVGWVDRVGGRLENDASLIRWNSDKRYLGELGELGIPVVETEYVAPGERVPPIDAEVVVKPTISAGARQTGRFGPGSAPAAAELIGEIHRAGRTAMVQPFLASVDSVGETAVVVIDGEVSHSLHKRALLAPDEVAPIRADGLGVAEAMYDPELVLAAPADEQEIVFATALIETVATRFGSVPLIARVDMLQAADGTPVLLELEAIEPNLYFDQVPSAGARLAEAILARAHARAGSPTRSPS